MGDRALLERERDRLTLAAHRPHEHRDPLGALAGADQPPDLGGHGLGLGALGRRAPEQHATALVAGQRLVEAIGVGGDHGPRGVENPPAAAARVVEDDGRRAGVGRGEVAQVARRRAPHPVQRLVVVAGRGDPAGIAGQRAEQPNLGEREVLELVHEHMGVAGTGPFAHVRTLVEQRLGAKDEVAGVEQPLLGQQTVVGVVERRELALALSVDVLRRQ